MQTLKVIAWIGLAFLALFIYKARTEKDVWKGFYYPDSSDLTNSITSYEMDSLNECRAWVSSQRAIFNPNLRRSDDYECGSNCRFDSGYGLNICEQTLR